MNKFFGWIKDHAPTILSWCASAGTIGGAVAAAKAMSKAQERLKAAYKKEEKRQHKELVEQIKKEKPELFDKIANEKAWDELSPVNLSTWQKITAVVPAFILPVLIEGLTIGCIQGADILNRRRIGTMNRTITGLKEALALGAAGAAVYKENVARIDPTVAYAADKMTVMEEADKQEGKTAWDEPQTFYIDGQPEFFERTMLQVFQAEVAFNKAFALLGCVTINDFYRFLDLPEVPDGDNRGFEGYLGEVYYGYRWIDFCHRPYQTEDGLWITEIVMPVEPHPLDEDEVNRELDEAIHRFNDGMTAVQRKMADDPPFQPDPRFG